MNVSFRCAIAIAAALFHTYFGAAQDPPSPNEPLRTPAEWVRELNSPDQKLRESARHALGSDGPFGEAAVAALIEAAARPNDLDHYEIALLLADHGSDTVPTLLKSLRRPEPGVRECAALALGRIHPRPLPAVPALIALLDDTATDVRRAAAGSLGVMRGASDLAVPALMKALRDREAVVRAAAADSLGEQTRRAKPAVGLLAATLRDRDPFVRYSAVEALGSIGPGAAASVPELTAALRDWLPESPRASLACTLAGIGPAAAPAVPVLVDVMNGSKEDDDQTRRWAINALGTIGPAARHAVPDLIRLAKDKGEPDDCREEAVMALGRIGQPAEIVVPFLIRQLDNRDSGISAYAFANALCEIGPAAKTVVPKLVAIARDRKADSMDRHAAVEAVEKIDPAYAAAEGIAFAVLNIRQGEKPAVALKPRPAVGENDAKQIRAWIAKLADVGSPGFGFSPTVSGRAFAPLPNRDRWQVGILGSPKMETPDPFKNLVSMGPTAIPFLLDALGDQTPTKLKVRGFPYSIFGVGGCDPEGNPFNPKERKAFARQPDEETESDEYDSYTLKVGDVCYVALGQIVGRDYAAVRYIPTAIVSVSVPTLEAKSRDQLRAAWSGPDPARVLLDSLLIDYATEGVFNGRSLDGWDEGSEYQIEAAVRLLYYFPDETAPMIAARLRKLDVSATDDVMSREVKNRVRTVEFLKAVAWCRSQPVQDALANIAARATDPEIKKLLAAERK